MFLPVFSSLHSTMEFNFQTFIHSCFIHSDCLCWMRMDGSPIFLYLPSFFFPSASLFPATYPMNYEFADLHIIRSALCHTGLSLDACCWSFCIFFGVVLHRNEPSKQTHHFSLCMVYVVPKKLRHPKISTLIRCQKTASHDILRTQSEQRASLGTPPHVEQRQVAWLPQLPSAQDFLLSENFCFLTGWNPRRLKQQCDGSVEMVFSFWDFVFMLLNMVSSTDRVLFGHFFKVCVWLFAPFRGNINAMTWAHVSEGKLLQTSKSCLT